ncbi:MAG: F0F1 ATP synthase subunit B [Pseudomonadota bacterium]|nr:MAG: F0F1 ATP synthase subunit B [Pseudomonadota bacterium]
MNINVTLVGQMITFALLVWFTMKLVWPPVMRAMADRQKTIADGLAQAERAKSELELAHKKATEILREAREDATGVMAEAGKRAANVIEDAKNQARAESERLLAAARAEIELEAMRAKEQLRTAIADLAVAGAARILQKEVDKAQHGKLLDEIVTKL